MVWLHEVLIVMMLVALMKGGHPALTFGELLRYRMLVETCVGWMHDTSGQQSSTISPT